MAVEYVKINFDDVEKYVEVKAQNRNCNIID